MALSLDALPCHGNNKFARKRPFIHSHTQPACVDKALGPLSQHFTHTHTNFTTTSMRLLHVQGQGGLPSYTCCRRRRKRDVAVRFLRLVRPSLLCKPACSAHLRRGNARAGLLDRNLYRRAGYRQLLFVVVCVGLCTYMLRPPVVHRKTLA